jgi:hypothetical protein
MKYVIFGTTKPDTASNREILDVFLSVGQIEGTSALLAGLDGRTFVVTIDTDDPSTLHKGALTYHPYFDEYRVIPVRDVDEAAIADIQEAQTNWPA